MVHIAALPFSFSLSGVFFLLKAAEQSLVPSRGLYYAMVLWY
jgi:hypothetical protein